MDKGTQEPSASDLRLLSRAHPLAPFSFRLRWACQLHICRSCDDEFRPRAQASALHQKAGRALVGGRRARFWHLVFMHRLPLFSMGEHFLLICGCLAGVTECFVAALFLCVLKR
eukprot:SM000265S09798  [mRNA]  locus=s265:17616:18462:- [translate_table: standard]